MRSYTFWYLGFSSLLPLLVFTCGPAPAAVEEIGPTSTVDSARQVVENAITAHGMEGLDSLQANFVFREREYGIERAAGRFRYTRSFVDSLGDAIVDVLTNEGLVRSRKGSVEALDEVQRQAYAESVNSVRYFFMLPYGLRDAAVQLEGLAPVKIDGSPYHRVKVTFAEAGGGTDFDDVYHYFFHQETGELDYLAYTFTVNDAGIRFRRAINKRRIGGVLVQDYVNYGRDGQDQDIDSVVEQYTAGELPELSRIENTGVRIRVGGE